MKVRNIHGATRISDVIDLVIMILVMVWWQLLQWLVIGMMPLYRQSQFIAFLITLTHPALADYPYHTTPYILHTTRHQYLPQPYLPHQVRYTFIHDRVQFVARLWYGMMNCGRVWYGMKQLKWAYMWYGVVYDGMIIPLSMTDGHQRPAGPRFRVIPSQAPL